MNRTARALLFLPVVALATSGVFTVACRGGGTLDGLDASWEDGEAVRHNAFGQACERAIVTIDDTAAERVVDDGPGCTRDDECTVRLEGDYCDCPRHPRPMLVAAAAQLDDSLAGITEKCTCRIEPCAPVPASRAVCREGRCALAD